MDDSIYEYSDFKVDPPRVDDGWYLVKDGITYRVEVPMSKMRFTKSINILTGEVHYPSKADRIRSMTDEELNGFLNEVQGDAYLVGFHARAESRFTPYGKSWLDWLKQEAVSDG